MKLDLPPQRALSTDHLDELLDGQPTALAKDAKSELQEAKIDYGCLADSKIDVDSSAFFL